MYDLRIGDVFAFCHVCQKWQSAMRNSQCGMRNAGMHNVECVMSFQFSVFSWGAYMRVRVRARAYIIYIPPYNPPKF